MGIFVETYYNLFYKLMLIAHFLINKPSWKYKLIILQYYAVKITYLKKCFVFCFLKGICTNNMPIKCFQQSI